MKKCYTSCWNQPVALHLVYSISHSIIIIVPTISWQDGRKVHRVLLQLRAGFHIPYKQRAGNETSFDPLSQNNITTSTHVQIGEEVRNDST